MYVIRAGKRVSQNEKSYKLSEARREGRLPAQHVKQFEEKTHSCVTFFFFFFTINNAGSTPY